MATDKLDSYNCTPCAIQSKQMTIFLGSFASDQAKLQDAFTKACEIAENCIQNQSYKAFEDLLNKIERYSDGEEVDSELIIDQLKIVYQVIKINKFRLSDDMICILFYSLFHVYTEVIAKSNISEDGDNQITFEHITYNTSDQLTSRYPKDINEILYGLSDIFFNITVKYSTPLEVIDKILAINISDLLMVSGTVANILGDGYESAKYLLQSININKLLLSLYHKFNTSLGQNTNPDPSKHHEVYGYFCIFCFLTTYWSDFKEDKSEVTGYFVDIITDHIEIIKSILLNFSNFSIFSLNSLYLIIQALGNTSKFTDTTDDQDFFICIKNILRFISDSPQIGANGDHDGKAAITRRRI